MINNNEIETRITNYIEDFLKDEFEVWNAERGKNFTKILLDLEDKTGFTLDMDIDWVIVLKQFIVDQFTKDIENSK